jgi:glucosamine-phosphate N-acetyltransferase
LKIARMTDEALPIVIRLMDATDLDRGFLEALAAIRPVDLTPQQAIQVYRDRLKSRVRTFVAIIDNRVAGTASIFVEPKFIHAGGVVGHIEDVAVHPDFQKRGIGKALVLHLLDECQKFGCYKVILDCAEPTIPFYEKLGFHRWERAMRIDL